MVVDAGRNFSQGGDFAVQLIEAGIVLSEDRGSVSYLVCYSTVVWKYLS